MFIERVNVILNLIIIIVWVSATIITTSTIISFVISILRQQKGQTKILIISKYIYIYIYI